jgi:hypothetical protein
MREGRKSKALFWATNSEPICLSFRANALRGQLDSSNSV